MEGGWVLYLLSYGDGQKGEDELRMRFEFWGGEHD